MTEHELTSSMPSPDSTGVIMWEMLMIVGR